MENRSPCKSKRISALMKLNNKLDTYFQENNNQINSHKKEEQLNEMSNDITKIR